MQYFPVVQCNNMLYKVVLRSFDSIFVVNVEKKT